MLRRNTEPRGYETMNPDSRREMARYATQNQDGHDRRYQDDYEEESDDYDNEYDDRPDNYRSRYQENDWDENDGRSSNYRQQENDWNESNRPSSNNRQQSQDWNEGNRPSSYYRGREEDWYESNGPSSNYRQQEQDWDEDENYDNVSNEFVDDEDVDEGNYNKRSRRRGAFYSTPERGRRGFASMSRDEVSRIGRKGGLASHRNERSTRHDQRSSDTRERRREGSSSRSNDSSTQKSNSNSSRRGFAAMSHEKVSRIARMGGLASHKNQQSKSSNGSKASTRRGTSRNR